MSIFSKMFNWKLGWDVLLTSCLDICGGALQTCSACCKSGLTGGWWGRCQCRTGGWRTAGRTRTGPARPNNRVSWITNDEDKLPAASSQYHALCLAVAPVPAQVCCRTCRRSLSSGHPARPRSEISASCPVSQLPPGQSESWAALSREGQGWRMCRSVAPREEEHCSPGS